MEYLRSLSRRSAAFLAFLLFACAAAFGQSVITANPDPAHEILSAPFQADTDARSHSRLTSGNRFELLENGVVSFPLKNALIATATAQLMVTTMVWGDDRTGRDFADALVARAQAGVAVRVVVDGEWGHPAIVRRLRQGGVKVARYNPWLFGIGGRTGHFHEKIVCADLARATVGGMNIADAYALGNGHNSDYHDVDIYVEGYAAGEVARRFLEIYTSLAPGDPDAVQLLSQVATFTQQPAAPAPGRDGYARVIVNEPDLGHHYVTDFYLRAFRAARHQIIWYVNNPVPVEPILSELKGAGGRGVRVVIITNSKAAYQARVGRIAGWWEYFWIKNFYRPRLRSAGIEIWEMDTPLHSKALTIDGVLASIGSYNFGKSSIRNNTEEILATYDPLAIRSVEEMIDRDLAKSQQVQ